MRVVCNLALARRRGRQATVLSVLGLAVLGVGLVFNFRGQAAYAYAALVLGSVASWTGIALADKWVRRPRADMALDAGLKGAGRAFVLYHWVLPAEHVLLAPWGLTVLLPSTVDGPVTIRDGKWREERSLGRRLLILGRRPLGNPPRLAAAEIDALARRLAADIPQAAGVPMDAAWVFLKADVAIEGQDEGLPAVAARDLRRWLRGQKSRPALGPSQRRALERGLDAVAAEALGQGPQ